MVDFCSDASFTSEEYFYHITMSVADPFVLREMNDDDVSKGFFELLQQLTDAPSPSRQDFHDQLALRVAHGLTTYVIIDASLDIVVATGALMVEPKFIRGLSFVGHIEDVVVHKEYQGKNLGRRIVKYLCEVAKEKKCYKVILDADEQNGAFYEKCGFRKKETQYRLDLKP